MQNNKFVLPEKWFIRGCVELNQYLKTQNTSRTGSIITGGYFYNKNNSSWGFKSVSVLLARGYIEISLQTYLNSLIPVGEESKENSNEQAIHVAGTSPDPNFANIPQLDQSIVSEENKKDIKVAIIGHPTISSKEFIKESMSIEINTPVHLLKKLLQFIGENPEREGLKDTPKRVIKSYSEIYSGYNVDIASIFTVFEDDTTDQIVLLKNIELYSMCEHHMLPFFGRAHVAYIPDKKIVGISKLARLVDAYAKRLQIQERIGQQVTAALDKYLQPKGSACIIEATHMCMRMRGVEKQNSEMTTSSVTGVFMTDSSAKQELLQLIKS